MTTYYYKIIIKLLKILKRSKLKSKQQKALHEEIKNFIVNVGWTHKIHVVHMEQLEIYSNTLNMPKLFSQH